MVKSMQSLNFSLPKNAKKAPNYLQLPQDWDRIWDLFSNGNRSEKYFAIMLIMMFSQDFRTEHYCKIVSRKRSHMRVEAERWSRFYFWISIASKILMTGWGITLVISSCAKLHNG